MTITTWRVDCVCCSNYFEVCTNGVGEDHGTVRHVMVCGVCRKTQMVSVAVVKGEWWIDNENVPQRPPLDLSPYRGKWVLIDKAWTTVLAQFNSAKDCGTHLQYNRPTQPVIVWRVPG